jgi:hypothetical protein
VTTTPSRTEASDSGQPFFAFIFDPGQEGKPDPDDLRGGARAPRRFVGWQTFFDFGDGEVKPNKRIDTKISSALFDLPLGAIASHDPPTALPQRTLLRHLTWQLPSGQRIAKAMGVRPLSRAQLNELAPLGVGFERSTPLWYYILRRPSCSPTDSFWAPSADASWPRSSSACCRRTAGPTYPCNRPGGRRCPAGTGRFG